MTEQPTTTRQPTITTFNTDVRGSIHRLELPDGPSFNLLYTRAGVARSGDVHPVEQYDLVLSGAWELWLRRNGEDVMEVKRAGDYLVIPPNTPHLFLCTQDSWMQEWWELPFSEMLDKTKRRDGKPLIAYYPRYRVHVDRMAQDSSYRPVFPDAFGPAEPGE